MENYVWSTEVTNEAEARTIGQRRANYDELFTNGFAGNFKPGPNMVINETVLEKKRKIY